MQLSIIIVSYNVKDFLEKCLHSVQEAAALLKRETEIIVIDNASSDGSAAYTKEKFPSVTLIANRENLGFAKACNQGIKISSGDYILFLNPDTLLPGNCFQKCISFFESHAEAGAVGVKMTDSKGRFLKESKRGFPSPAASFYKLFGFARLFPTSKRFAKYYLGHLDENQNHEADILSGAFMMTRRNVLEKTGYFDESFFMYGEDIDLSHRIQQAGYKNYYLSEVTITHFKGKSNPGKESRYINEFYKAMNIFADKYYSKKTNPVIFYIIRAGIWTRKMIALAGNFFGKTRLKMTITGGGVN